MTAWRCSVCGYVHRGPEPPEGCPVCGVPRSEFEPHAEPVPTPRPPAVRRWRCTVCGYVHEGPEPPGECPVCGVGPELFEPAPEPAAPAAPAPARRVVIVGAGIAGVAAAEAVRKAAPDSSFPRRPTSPTSAST